MLPELILIGAPLGDYTYSFKNKSTYPNKPGNVIRCGMPGPCEYITPLKNENKELYLDQVNIKVIIQKENGWFGSAIAIEKRTGILTVCAPRTKMSMRIPYTNKRIDSMHGFCYNGFVSSNHFSLEDKNVLNYDFRKPFWYNPLHGFSVHYPNIQHNREIHGTHIIGEPNHELYGTLDIEYLMKQESVELSIGDESSKFGYSVTSGAFFKTNELLYASGAPGWGYVGLVAIISPQLNFSIIAKIQGNDVGETFGASLAAGDLNNDGFTDLIIGAPHWEQDNGKVYIYFGNSKGLLEAPMTLHGEIEGALFGYAIVCGDLDKDGFSDIIIGAPWEDSGVLYVYNGDSTLKNIRKIELSQRITATQLQERLPGLKRSIHTFGFSLSEPIDTNVNGYSYMAIGAYKSGQVIILQSSLVVKTNLTIYSVPTILQRNITKFLIFICVSHQGNHIQRKHDFLMTVTIDEGYKRTKETVLQYISSTSPGVSSCANKSITILDNVQNFIDPIVIITKHEFTMNNTLKNNSCGMCPVESKGAKFKIAQLSLPFDIDCGEDKICNSNIFAVGKFHGVQNNNTWVIGSNDVSLEIQLQNHGEPAYSSLIVFILPKGIILRSMLPSCQDTSTDDLMITCDIGNPLTREEQKIIKLDLDMRHYIYNPLNNYSLQFDINIKTHSVNYGTTNISMILYLISEAALSINGKANEEKYYFPTLSNKTLRVTFQHIYQIIKFGATPILDAKLTVEIPTTLGNSSTLVYVYKPQFYMSGKTYECLPQNVSFIETLATKSLKKEPLLEQLNSKETMNDQETKYEAINKSKTSGKRSLNNFYKNESNQIQVSRRKMQIFGRGEKLENNLNVTKTILQGDITYFNCSTHNVQCSTFVCDLSSLRTSQDIGKLIVKLVFDVTKLEDYCMKQRKIIQFSSKAHVEIIQPLMNQPIFETRSTLHLTTVFYSALKAEKLQLWIVFVSVFLGLILLCISIVVLNLMGFFKRNKKQKLITLKTTVSITDCD